MIVVSRLTTALLPWPSPPPLCRAQIGQLDEKLEELEQERAELQEYQRHDRRRRCLEYTIYDKEITKIKAEMEKVQGERGGGPWVGAAGCVGGRARVRMGA